jgi:hypothetical protein
MMRGVWGKQMAWRWFCRCSPLLAAMTVACGGGGAAPKAKPCDAECQDETALRALRETLKLVYNLTLQANPVGHQDETTPCPQGGTAHVAGEATSNAQIGTTDIDLTFELDACSYLQRDDQPEQSYGITTTGTVVESGVLAVQPSGTTAILFSSDSVTLTGTVYDPAIDYSVTDCPLEAGQNGSRIAGTLCGRDVAFQL